MLQSSVWFADTWALRARRLTAAARGRRFRPVFRLSLCSPSQSLRRVDPVSPEEVVAWWTDRVPLGVPPTAVAPLEAWDRELRGEAPPTVPSWRPEGPGRTPAEAAPLIAFLRDRARDQQPFTFNALYRERQGGRTYPFVIPNHSGPVTISKRQYDAAGGRRQRLLLSAIRRDVRRELRAPSGWSLLELDYKSCHAAIGLALSGDEQLSRDLDGDIHQLTGDRLVPHHERDAAKRRDFGKAVNLAMLFGVTHHGLRDLTREHLGRDPRDGTGETAWVQWWGRYPRLATFRDEVRHLVLNAQPRRWGIEVEAPSERISRFSPGEVAGRVGKGDRPAPGYQHVWRTIFSACFRAVEGDLLDQTLRRFHASNAGGQPVLPLYDGGLFAAPAGAEVAVTQALADAAAKAVVDIGIPKLHATVTRR